MQKKLKFIFDFYYYFYEKTPVIRWTRDRRFSPSSKRIMDEHIFTQQQKNLIVYSSGSPPPSPGHGKLTKTKPTKSIIPHLFVQNEYIIRTHIKIRWILSTDSKKMNLTKENKLTLYVLTWLQCLCHCPGRKGIQSDSGIHWRTQI